MTSGKKPAGTTAEQKQRHIDLCRAGGVEFRGKTTGLEAFDIIPQALPEMNRADVDPSVRFLNWTFSFPLLISSMTGGTKLSQTSTPISPSPPGSPHRMGLGSCKRLLLDPSQIASYRVRSVAPKIFLCANLGGSDLHRFSTDEIKRLLETLDANALIVHLNAAQELVQDHGNRDFSNVLENINRIAQKIPTIVKEVGAGIDAPTAHLLQDTAIVALDVAGAGGTSWTAVEYRYKDATDGLLWDWGIPTADSIQQCRPAFNRFLIASGGIRTAEDMVKSFILGADCCGMATPLLEPALTSSDTLCGKLSALKTAYEDLLYLTGSRNLTTLKTKTLTKSCKNDNLKVR